MLEFDAVWSRTVAHSGETFRQIRGGEFSYQIDGNSLIPDRTNQTIPRAHFAEAFDLVPLPNTVPLQHLRGPSYIFAVLMDTRIRRQDW